MFKYLQVAAWIAVVFVGTLGGLRLAWLEVATTDLMQLHDQQARLVTEHQRQILILRGSISADKPR